VTDISDRTSDISKPGYDGRDLMLCSAAGAWILIYNVRNIEFLTFSEQPILKPRLPRPQPEVAYTE
jgi:hypothetical protein